MTARGGWLLVAALAVAARWYISGATDTRWDDDDLHSLATVTGSAFEVVQTGGITPG
jgi:hypothetical protein